MVRVSVYFESGNEILLRDLDEGCEKKQRDKNDTNFQS